VLESDNVERLFTFVEMEKELKKTNRSYYQYPGRIPPDAVRSGTGTLLPRSAAAARGAAAATRRLWGAHNPCVFRRRKTLTPSHARASPRLSSLQGGEYSLFFANCQSHVVVSLTIEAELYNEAWTGARDYLSAGEAPLPVLFLVMSILYFMAAAIWGGVLYQHKKTTLKIHYLMLALISFKALATMCEAGMYHMKRTTGSPDGWNIAYYIFSLFRGVLLFTVIVLIGTGWSFLKPFLSAKEKQVIMVVFPLQVLANVADIILLEQGPSVKGWFTWRDIFHLLDIVCCCAILFPIVWSIKHLREAAHSDGKAARNLHKLTLFRQFYVMVVSYIYFTRIVVYLLKSTTPYQYVWLSDCAGELATLAFYCFTGFKFRPVSDNPYFHLEMDELDESEQELVRRELAENAAQSSSARADK
jgi:hypothetical protein